MASTEAARSGIDLVAVLLITRSRPGPKLVFHYPTRPEHRADTPPPRDATLDSDSEGEDESGSPSGERLRSRSALAGPNPHDKDQSPLEHLFGYSVEALEKLLSPGRWSDRKKFEICLDGLTFIGHPIHSAEDGRWSERPAGDPKKLLHQRVEDRDFEHVALPPAETSDRLFHDFTHIPESLDSQADFGLGASTDSNSTTSAAVIEQMAMFHVVFVLRTSDHEDVHGQATTIYQNVAKKLSKALHYCQKQSNYVALESQKLLSMVAKSRQREVDFETLWDELADGSEMAWALRELHRQLSRGGLATLRLSGMEISLHAGPTPSSGAGHLGPFSALLLLEPKDALLRALPHPDASPLAHLIREHTPTKSLHKHSARLSMPLSDVLYLAHHLLRWRKARPVAPLHQRNTYVVHPSLDPSALPALADSYRRAFPSLPPLPHMLRVLSGRPIKYGVLIPSRDHRGPYMDILAFLVRHRLVAQLETFGWLRLPPPPPPPPPGPDASAPSPSPAQPDVPSSRPPSRLNPPPGSPNLLSPHLRPSSTLPSIASPGGVGGGGGGGDSDDALSVASDLTAIPFRGGAGVPSTGTITAATNTPRSNPGIAGPGAETDPVLPGLLLNPAEPSAAERAGIASLRAGLADAELREKFDALLPFLDGRHAFEEVAARLLVKRARVEEWVGEGEREGWLMVFRHT